MDERFYSIAQAQTELGNIGRTKFYQLAARHELELVKLDGKSLVTGRSLQRFKQKLLDQLVAA